jgi:hypothetical protein
MTKCTFDPMEYANEPIGMFHCPKCGEMVLSGMPHPDYEKCIEPKNGMFFSIDLKSLYKSIWIGCLLITWTQGVDSNEWPSEIHFKWGLE